MLVRLVQIELLPENTDLFIALFANHKEHIQLKKGCLSLELLQDNNQPTTVATLSRWATQGDLDNYRNSDFFKNLWAQIKPLFASKARAISYQIAG